MRGKVWLSVSFGFTTRITPAYAGKSIFSSKAWRLANGSPPPMRGKGIIFHNITQILRITPAYAGKRIRRYNATGAARDHPRLCGEKCYFLTITTLDAGSPPPMRGKGKKTKCRHNGFGITPAYAGKRVSTKICTHS